MPKLHALHPGTAFFGLPREGGTFIEDVKRWGRMMRGTLGPDLLNAKANGTVADFKALYEKGLGGTPLAVDIETAAANSAEPWTGKNPTRARLKTIAVGTAEGGVSMFWADAPEELRSIIRIIMADSSVTKVFHNGYWFDLRVMARFGIPVSNVEDSRDLRRALSSTSRLSLGYLGSLYCDISNWKQQESEEGDGKFWESDDLVKLQEYNAKDTIVTARVWTALRKDAGEDERVAALYEQHKKLSQLTARMHTKGIWVHQPWRAFMHECMIQSIAEKEVLLKSLVGQEDFPCTDHAMRALIYRRHQKDGIKCFGLPDPWDKRMWTNEHQETISVDEASLIQLIVGGACPSALLPIIEAYWDLQGEKKRLGYIKSELFDQALGPDGRLRAGWNSCGTDTGRFSCSEPNVMNIEQLLRHMLAPAPGCAIVHADKKQLEIRVMSVVAADMVLQDAIDSGDLYTAEARGYFGIPDGEPVKKAARQSAKIIRLGRQYGAGIPAVYAQALRMDRTFTLSRTKALVASFDKRYYRTISYWKEEMARVLECGFSEDRIMGRRRTYPRPPELSETVNYPIQATAASMMNTEILILDERLRVECPSAYIIIQLHDAVDVECPENKVPQVERIIDEVMDRDWTFCGMTRKFGIDRKTTYHSKGGTWADV
jgi:DNA polymerase I-like protein with 3'-5' exonuclease and polymerase domains